MGGDDACENGGSSERVSKASGIEALPTRGLTRLCYNSPSLAPAQAPKKVRSDDTPPQGNL